MLILKRRFCLGAFVARPREVSAGVFQAGYKRPSRFWIVGAVIVLAPLFAAVPNAAKPQSLPIANRLYGDWLLTGTLPIDPRLGSGRERPGFALAANFAVEGNKITAAYGMVFPCPSTGLYGMGGDTVTGTLQADGSFVLAPPVPPGRQATVGLTIRGKLPQDGELTWDGTYSLVLQSKSGCEGTVEGAIHASPIAIEPGHYSGTATFQDGNHTTSETNVSLTLKPRMDSGDSSEVGSLIHGRGLDATLSIEGSDCLNPAGQPMNAKVMGSSIYFQYLSTDRSKIDVSAIILSKDLSKLSLDIITIAPGSCNQKAQAFSVPLSRLD